jgi:hypothetical protein
MAAKFRDWRVIIAPFVSPASSVIHCRATAAMLKAAQIARYPAKNRKL